MNRLFFLFFSILFIGSISSQNISIIYPEQVAVNEEFSVVVELYNFETGIYDIKIDILKEEERISKIFKGENWTSTYYYLNDAIIFGKKETFKLKIFKNFNEAKMIVKIRNSQGSVLTFENYGIEEKVVNSEENIKEPEKVLDVEETKEIEIEETTAEEENQVNYEPLIEEISQPTTTLEIKPLDVIKLNAKDIKEENSNQENKEENSIEKYANFGLVALCIFLLILLFLNRKNALE